MTTRAFIILAIAAMLLGSERACHATVVFDNGNHVTSTILSSGPFTVSTNRAADDFVIPLCATIRGVHWKGAYTLDVSPIENFTISIYEDDGSGFPTPPGTAIYSAEVGNVPGVLTGEVALGTPIFAYSAEIPDFVASPGTTYWVEIFNEVPGYLWGWSADQAVGNSVITDFGTVWIRIDAEHTFQLADEFIAIPEASPLAFFSAPCALGIVVATRKVIA